jgi:hypothetical protein
LTVLTLILIEVALALAVYSVARWAGLRPRAIQVPLVLASALPPLFDEALGEMFRIDPGARPIHPAWVPDALWYAFHASIGLGLAVIVLAKGYRIPAAVFALPQIPLTWLLGFLGGMQVTGNWI